MSETFSPQSPASVKPSMLKQLIGGMSPSKIIMFVIIALIVVIRELPKLLKNWFFKAPKDYLTRYLKQIQRLDKLSKKSDAGASYNEKTVMINFGLKSGAIRRQLILNTRSPSAINYSNYLSLTKFKNGDKIALSKEDRDDFRGLIENCKQVDCNNKYIVGIFHPYCNAGGGGEKVLWKLVADLQQQLPSSVKIVIYTGDLEISPIDIITKVNQKFNYNINIGNISFIYLTKRKYVDGKYWRHFTLIAQALSSIVLGLEAIRKCPPDCFIDTMGYPFIYPVIQSLLKIPVVSYTHYPVIQQDMLNSVGNSMIKKLYWKTLLSCYKRVGSYVDISITNSTWTNNHMNQIWSRLGNTIIYPPCFESEIADQVLLKMQSFDQYQSLKQFQCVLVAQFRPEKRHKLAITKYAEYLKNTRGEMLKMVFIGSTRGTEDEEFVDHLKRYAFEDLKIPQENMKFHCNLSFDDLQKTLQESMFGLNCMWNEHFGISVVEYMVNGCVPLVHASAGPLLDIVVNNYTSGVFFQDAEDPDFKTAKSDKYLSLDKVFEYVSTKKTAQDYYKIALENIETVKNKFSDEKFDIDFNQKILPSLSKKIWTSKDARFKEDEELA